MCSEADWVRGLLDEFQIHCKLGGLLQGLKYCGKTRSGL